MTAITERVLTVACLSFPWLATAQVPAASQLSVCTSETPFQPLSSADPATPGTSQILIERVAKTLGIAIRNEFSPWKRCQVLVERGISDALNIAGYSGINPQIAAFPMRGGRPDTLKSLGSVASILYRRVGTRADFISGRIVHTDKPVAVLAGRQVNMDAIARAGGTSDDGATTVAALAKKLVAGQVDLAVSELAFAEMVASQYPGVLEALPAPLVESHYYLAFSKQYYARHAAVAEAFWNGIAEARTGPGNKRAPNASR